ncbi:MAG TPA: FIST N-terminal domain-containing protein [Patescibacteria group bacterium]|nr:FIST N-terminal domain-containing protein [Patescibacteria group bacterium]
MKYKIGKSSCKDALKAIQEATVGLQTPKLIWFTSGVPEFAEYSKVMKAAFPNSIIIGTTTYAAFCKDGAFKDTLLVMGIEDGIECYGDVLEEVDKYPLKYVERVERCANQLSGNTGENTICFECTTALLSCEELVLSTLNAVLMKKNIPVFGGSAGDRGVAEKTLISFNGTVYHNACAFVLIKNLGGKIKLYRENIYKPTKHHFKATKVDVKNRCVYEYNHSPAAQVTAQALGTTADNLGKYLNSYPLGRIIGNDMYITANNSVTAHNGMAYHARVYKNSEMVLLEPDNYKEVLRQTMDQVKSDVPKPSLSLMVNCLARSMLFESDAYADKFATDMGSALGNYVGFAGYGEQLKEQHFNQTMVLAVFE